MPKISPRKPEAKRRSAQKSTGPKTAEGKARSHMNALKHGVTAENSVLPGEDPARFRTGVEDFKTDLQPRSAFERGMVERMALASWQFDRAARVDVARLAMRMETAAIDAAQRAEQDVIALGERLFFDRRGPLPDYEGRDRDRKMPWTSCAGIPSDPDSPTLLVKQLEYTAAGCRWLLDRWAELRARLEAGQCWQSPEKLRAVRLLGRQPFDAADVPDVAMIYLACHVLRPLHKYVFHELKQEVFAEDFDNYEKRLKDRELEVIRPRSPAAAKDVLLRIVDRATARLEILTEAHRLRDEKLAGLRADAAAFDDSAEPERLRRYVTACNRAFHRTFADFLKTREDVEAPEIDITDPVQTADQPASSPPTAADAMQLQIQNEPGADDQKLRMKAMPAGERGVPIDEILADGGKDAEPKAAHREVADLQDQPKDDPVQVLPNEPKPGEQALQRTRAALVALQNLLIHSTTIVPAHERRAPGSSGRRPPPTAGDGKGRKHRRNRQTRSTHTSRSANDPLRDLAPGDLLSSNSSHALDFLARAIEIIDNLLSMPFTVGRCLSLPHRSVLCAVRRSALQDQSPSRRALRPSEPRLGSSPRSGVY
jgi:hypothetical protein